MNEKRKDKMMEGRKDRVRKNKETDKRTYARGRLEIQKTGLKGMDIIMLFMRFQL